MTGFRLTALIFVTTGRVIAASMPVYTLLRFFLCLFAIDYSIAKNNLRFKAEVILSESLQVVKSGQTLIIGSMLGGLQRNTRC